MKPLWRQMFDAVEQAAGPAMADATASKAFADFAKVSTKISKDMTRQFESASRQWLHMWNLPAAGDVAAMKRQIGSLESQLRTMQREAQDQHLRLLETAKFSAKKGGTKS